MVTVTLNKSTCCTVASFYLNGSDGEGNLPPTIDIRVENTKNVLELLGDDQRLETKGEVSDG